MFHVWDFFVISLFCVWDFSVVFYDWDFFYLHLWCFFVYFCTFRLGFFVFETSFGNLCVSCLGCLSISVLYVLDLSLNSVVRVWDFSLIFMLYVWDFSFIYIRLVCDLLLIPVLRVFKIFRYFPCFLFIFVIPRVLCLRFFVNLCSLRLISFVNLHP